MNSTLITGGNGERHAAAAVQSDEPAVTEVLTKEDDEAMNVDTGK